MDFSNVDERFQSVFHDKKFRSIRQKQRKINIDRRFHSMFTDDNFKVSYGMTTATVPYSDSGL